GVGRAKLIREHGGMLDRYSDDSATEPPSDQLDAFYAGWVDEILQSTVDGLLEEYDQSGKGDYFRVLSKRLCGGLTVPEIADSLQIKVTAAENYLRHARQRLSDRLRETVQAHVERYSSPEQLQADVSVEWMRLGEFLQNHGGLEAVVRRTYATLEPGS